MIPAHAKRIDDARRLLQARVDRRAPADMIDRARRNLAEAIAATDAQAPAQAAARRGWWGEFWRGEVGSPLPVWQPGTLGPIGKTGGVIGAVVGGGAVGLLASRLLHSETGKYAAIAGARARLQGREDVLRTFWASPDMHLIVCPLNLLAFRQRSGRRDD